MPIKAFLAGVTAISCLFLNADSGEAHVFSVVAGDRIVGSMDVAEGDAGRTIHFRYEDRGNGPNLTKVYSLDERDQPLSVAISGVNYHKKAVKEAFDCSTGHMATSGEACGGFYLSSERLPEDVAALARALLRSADRRLDLLPNGTARIQTVDHISLHRDGQTRTLTLYAIEGLEFLPVFVWLDDDGELFFTVYGQALTIRKGWEKNVAGLLNAQHIAARTILSAATAPARQTTDQPLFIHDVALFDPHRRRLRHHMSVLVRDGKIEAVGHKLRAPASAKIIEGRGMTLLPGLWDMHVHTSDLSQGILNLASGVTSVRDMGTSTHVLQQYQAWFDNDVIPGPRIFKAGIIDGPGPFAAPVDNLVSSADEMVSVIDRYAKLGYEQIKLYGSVKPELVPVAVAEAHRLGLRISGHVPAGMTASQAVAFGFDGLQHMNFVLLDFYPDVAGQTASRARTTIIGDRAGTLRLDTPTARSYLALLKRHDVVIDPTMTVFEGQYDTAPNTYSPMIANVRYPLPAPYLRQMKGSGLAHDELELSKYRSAFEAMKKMLLKLHEHGVRLVPGTDGFTGFALKRELEIWADAGIPNADVLYAATLGAASVNGHDDELGSIEPGKCADMVLVKGNPLKDISSLRNVIVTIKNGNVYDPIQLLAAINITPMPDASSGVTGAR